MTSERRTLIELRDIAGIEFGCPECGVSMYYPIGEGKSPRFPAQCPNCNAMWIAAPGPNAPPVILANELRAALMNFQRLIYSSDVKAHIRFQVSSLSETK